MNIDDLLDRPIAFHRPFVKISGSVTSALFLSQAFYWSKRTTSGDGSFYKTQSEWQEETGLTRFEQETARKNLRNLGLVREDLRGVPARLHYSVCREKLWEMLDLQSSMLESSKLECGKPANKDAGNQQTTIQSETTSKNTTETTHSLFSLSDEEQKDAEDKSNPSTTTQETERKKAAPKKEKIPFIAAFDHRDAQPLLSIDGILDMWARYVAHRKGLRKPLTSQSAPLTLKELAKRPHEALRALETCLSKTWGGFEWEWIDSAAKKAPIGAYREPVKENAKIYNAVDRRRSIREAQANQNK